MGKVVWFYLVANHVHSALCILHFTDTPTTTPAAPVVLCTSHIPASQITQRLALIPRTVPRIYHLADSHLALYPRPVGDLLSSVETGNGRTTDGPTSATNAYLALKADQQKRLYKMLFTDFVQAFQLFGRVYRLLALGTDFRHFIL